PYTTLFRSALRLLQTMKPVVIMSRTPRAGVSKTRTATGAAAPGEIHHDRKTSDHDHPRRSGGRHAAGRHDAGEREADFGRRRGHVPGAARAPRRAFPPLRR